MRKLYEQYCAGCHGADLRGGKASSLLDQTWRQGGDDESLRATIENGIPASGMPGFKATFTPAETRAMVILLRETAERSVAPELKGVRPLPSGVQRAAGQEYRIEDYAYGFDVPWAMAFTGPDELFVTERAGRLRRIVEGKLHPEPIRNTPRVWARDEGGLLCVAVDPDYRQNGWVYLSFSDPGPNDTAMTKIVRGRVRDHAWTDEEVLFALEHAAYSDSGMGFGCRLLFSGEHLYFTLGERGRVGAAQDLGSPFGKVHRIHRDGTIPSDNPFAGKAGALGSIYSLGNRNPQGLAIDPRNGDLWSTEHGPRGGDELNQIRPGANYGWPIITHGMNYDGTPVSALTEKPGLEQPRRHWTPSIAVCPILFYSGDRFPAWKNRLFLGSLAQQEFLIFTVEDSQLVAEERVFKDLGRVRDIQTGPDGLIYLSMEPPGTPGRILRLVPVEGSRPAP